MPEADMLKGKKLGVEKHYFQRQVLSHVPNSVSNSIMTSPKISVGKHNHIAAGSK